MSLEMAQWRIRSKRGLAVVRRYTASNTTVFPYFQLVGGTIVIVAIFAGYDWRWWAFSVSIYFLYCCLGLSVTYHRFLTHRSFEMAKWQEYLFSWFGAMGATGSTIGWVAMHKHHHANADRSGDPHSPHIDGWKILSAKLRFNFNKWNVRRLVNDPFHRILHQYYHGFLAGWAMLLYLFDPLVLLFGFIVPAALQINVSSLSNYGNHRHGYRNFETNDRSTNNPLVAFLAWGEGWHNNHHRFPRRWNLHIKWWEIDPTGWVIRALYSPPETPVTGDKSAT